MKKVLSILLTLFACLLFLCSCGSKNYEVKVTDGSVYVTMKAPSVGVSGVNEVSFDGFTLAEIEEEIFDEIQDRKYYGDYDVYVTLRFENQYGQLYERGSVRVCTLDANDVKKYVDYSYFRGSIPFSNAFQWNHNYTGPEREVVEPTMFERFLDWLGSTWGMVCFAIVALLFMRIFNK